MADSAVIQSSLSAYYRMIQTRVHELAAPLSDEQLWTRPFPYGNSVGNLILHLTGNLSTYIGAQIGGTGYVRNRPLEFTDAAGGWAGGGFAGRGGSGVLRLDQFIEHCVE